MKDIKLLSESEMTLLGNAGQLADDVRVAEVERRRIAAVRARWAQRYVGPETLLILMTGELHEGVEAGRITPAARDAEIARRRALAACSKGNR